MERKYRGITVVEMSDIAAARTRPRALALEAVVSTSTAKRRKINAQESSISTSYLKLGSGTSTNTTSSHGRGRVTIPPDSMISPSPEVNSGPLSMIEERCASPSSDRASASCCSSNGSSERIKFTDPTEENVEGETSMDSSCRERREMTPSSELLDELDSTARPTEANPGRSCSTEKKMPTESELEEFFAEAEKGIKKYFMKYNYDIEKDEPLEGRWEWVRLKP